MKNILILLGVLLPFFWSTAAEPLTVAVLDFSSTGTEETGAKNEAGAQIAILLNANLSASPDIIMVERSELAKVLGEQELGLSGTVTPDTAAKVGHLTGAKVLITGRTFEAGGKQYAVARIISTETSRVYGETVTYADKSGFDAAYSQLSAKVLKTISDHADTLVAKTEEPGAQIERLKKLVAGKKLPSVAVTIPESHVSHQIPDPAAETELRLILAQVGFRIIDTKLSTEIPDILIKGEAFSEFGARKGNLVSCRARVEIQVLKDAGKTVVWSDRQTDAGVDLSENIAAKEALAHAAAQLADRIVPKLVE